MRRANKVAITARLAASFPQLLDPDETMLASVCGQSVVPSMYHGEEWLGHEEVGGKINLALMLINWALLKRAHVVVTNRRLLVLHIGRSSYRPRRVAAAVPLVTVTSTAVEKFGKFSFFTIAVRLHDRRRFPGWLLASTLDRNGETQRIFLFVHRGWTPELQAVRDFLVPTQISQA